MTAQAKMTHPPTGIEYLVIMDEEGNYCVEVPSLPGCLTFGRTMEEAIHRASEAITGYLEAEDIMRNRQSRAQSFHASVNMASAPITFTSSGSYGSFSRREVWSIAS